MAQDHIWAPLAEGQPTHHREPGQMIYLQDTEAAQFYYILTGTVKCFISSPDGDERTLALHHGGELIGEASFFDRQPRVSSAVAVTPCELISVNRQHLEAVFARRPDLAISMLEYLARTVRLLSGHVDSAFLQADKRIARHLLALEPDARGLLHCTHEEIGSSVGVSRVTVSRVLGDFDRRGRGILPGLLCPRCVLFHPLCYGGQGGVAWHLAGPGGHMAAAYVALHVSAAGPSDGRTAHSEIDRYHKGGVPDGTPPLTNAYRMMQISPPEPSLMMRWSVSWSLARASSGMRLSLPFKSSLTSSWKDLPKMLDCQMALVSPSNS